MGRGAVHSAPLKVKYHLWQQALLHLSLREPLKRTLRALSERSLVNVQSWNTAQRNYATDMHCAGCVTFVWICKMSFYSETWCSVHQDTYCYFTQIDPIIQRIPGALLVVGPPGLLEDLADALAFLTFEPITTRDAWRPWNAVGPWITVSARGACWPLHAATILKKKQHGREEVNMEVDDVKKRGQHNNNNNSNRRVYCYRTSCFPFSFFFLWVFLGCMHHRHLNAAIHSTITHKRPDDKSFKLYKQIHGHQAAKPNRGTAIEPATVKLRCEWMNEKLRVNKEMKVWWRPKLAAVKVSITRTDSLSYWILCYI